MSDPLSELFEIICDRIENPVEDSYTYKLMAGGDNSVLKKIGEEAGEVIMAFKDRDDDEIAEEVADLFFHLLLALAYYALDLDIVYRKLEERRK